tara:strand:+ start:2508 stop:2813 length:306 start_codon:yes stop_codon:yes gene_type:complete
MNVKKKPFNRFLSRYLDNFDLKKYKGQTRDNIFKQKISKSNNNLNQFLKSCEKLKTNKQKKKHDSKYLPISRFFEFYGHLPYKVNRNNKYYKPYWILSIKR